MKKVKIIYNDKKMVFKNPHKRGEAHTRYAGGGDEVKSYYLPITCTARNNYCRWGKEFFQAEPEQFARSLFDARYAQGGQTIKQGVRQ